MFLLFGSKLRPLNYFCQRSSMNGISHQLYVLPTVTNNILNCSLGDFLNMTCLIVNHLLKFQKSYKLLSEIDFHNNI